jgi:iron-sulfur cluster repair protein YtfE (RIC family)
MLRKAMEKCGITSVTSYNGGKITSSNGMTKESAKAQMQPTTQHVKAVYNDGHTENLRKCTILANAIKITHNENKEKVKANLHKIVDKI